VFFFLRGEALGAKGGMAVRFPLLRAVCLVLAMDDGRIREDRLVPRETFEGNVPVVVVVVDVLFCVALPNEDPLLLYPLKVQCRTSVRLHCMYDDCFGSHMTTGRWTSSSSQMDSFQFAR
jgi:hypothetical protein